MNTAETWRVSYPLGAHWAVVNKQIRDGNISCGTACRRYIVFHHHSLKPINHWSLSTGLNLCCFFFSFFLCVGELDLQWNSCVRSHQQANRQKAQDQRNIKMDHTLKIGESGKPLQWCAFLTLALYTDMLWTGSGGVDGCVFSPGQCSLNGVHLSPPACLFSFCLELPKGKVYIWQNEKQREICPFSQRGMKELSRVPFEWQLNPRFCLPFGETTFHLARLSGSSLMKPVSFPSLWLCVCVCVHAQVSSPQSPWRWCPIQPDTCRDKRLGRRWAEGVQSFRRAGEK